MPFLTDRLPCRAAMEKAIAGSENSRRLIWLDIMKGVSILWILFFHFFLAYDNGRFPWPLNIGNFASFVAGQGPASAFETLLRIVEGIIAAVFERGAEGVGVFVVLSGFGLTYSLLRPGNPSGGWTKWYSRRLLRLFPIYWLAHLIYVVSPFVNKWDPVDLHILLSLLGDRMVPIGTMFYYLVPAWWFFGLLLQLYVVFPLLFRFMQKAGPVVFLVVCCAITIASRYVLFAVLHANGNYVQGGLFACRLWEFAFGMVLGRLYRVDPVRMNRWLFSRPILAGGILLYILGSYSYEPTFTYSLTDILLGTGLFAIIANLSRWIERPAPIGTALATVGVYSYSVYLFHQPYVMYIGYRLQGFEMPAFLGLACVTASIVALVCIPLEKYANRLMGRLFDR